MSAGLQQLYRETVLAHSREPHNFRRLEAPDRTAEGHNLLCGDKLSLYLHLDGEAIADIGFEGSGCAISLASASMMTDYIKGLPLTAAGRTVADILLAFDSGATPAPSGPGTPRESLPGELAALAGVRAYPSRVRCATLPWQTLRAALDEQPGPVSTE